MPAESDVLGEEINRQDLHSQMKKEPVNFTGTLDPIVRK